jgi:two-component system, chemotaxis family, chemotaxis protein CheY
MFLKSKINSFMQQTGTIFIVEDDQQIREALREVLELEGYAVSVASDGKQALEYLRSIAFNAYPSLILLDLMMPVMNGWDLLRILEKDSALQKIPVVVLSASGGVIAGCEHALAFVQKPFSLDTLLELVKKHSSSRLD